ncbi:MAG: hypothetical protein RR354_05370 [Mucinivorans sp.]
MSAGVKDPSAYFRAFISGAWLLLGAIGLNSWLFGVAYTPLGAVAQGVLAILSSWAMPRPKVRYILSPLWLCFLFWLLYGNVIYVYEYVFDSGFGFLGDRSFLAGGAYLSLVSSSIFGALATLLCGRYSLLVRRELVGTHACGDFRGLMIAATALAACMYYWSIVLDAGVLSAMGEMSRLDVTQALETGKLWLVQYLFVGLSMAAVLMFSVGVRLRVYVLVPILLAMLAFWGGELLVGNRRGFVSLMIFCVVLYAAMGRISLFARGLVVGLLAFLVFIGVARQGGEYSDASIVVLNGIGEFYFPHVTFLGALANDAEYKFGATIFAWWFDFVAAKVGSEPYLFLSQQFSESMADGAGGAVIGYAYMPLTEAYLNFGVIGALLAPVMVIMSYEFIRRFAGAGRGVLLLVLSAMGMDINRGEFSAIFLQYGIIVFALMSVLALSGCVPFVLRAVGVCSQFSRRRGV